MGWLSTWRGWVATESSGSQLGVVGSAPLWQKQAMNSRFTELWEDSRTLARPGLFVLALALFANGCTPLRYSVYTGKQGNLPIGIWPIGSGTMAETSHAVPVYRGWPEKPYRVLGSIRFEDPNKYWDGGVVDMVASMAKHQGGDAIIIRVGSEFGVSKITGTRNDPLVRWQQSETSGLVIKWLSDSEALAQQQETRQLMDKFYAAHPNVSANQNVGEIVAGLLVQSGVDPKSDELLTKFSETMLRITSPPDGTLSGEWVFKGTVSTGSSITSGGDENFFLGTATVTAEGESIAIVSDSGGTEINFNGTLTKGALRGQLGIGASSAKCEGAAFPTKISLSFQSLTSDGVARGNVVFQRLQLKTSPKEHEKTQPGVSHNRPLPPVVPVAQAQGNR